MCNSTPSAPPADPKVGEYYGKMGDISAEQWAFMKNTFLPEYLKQQGRSIATSENLTQEQIAMSQSQRDMANLYRQRMEGKLFPMQDIMAQEAMTAGGAAEQGQRAGEAKADVRQSFAQQRAMEARRMAALGLNPASGAYRGNESRGAIAEALGTASAGTRARDMAKQLGWAKKADVAASLQGMMGGQATAAQSAMSGFGSANQMAYSPLAAMAQGSGAYTSGMGSAAAGMGGAGGGFQGLSNYGLNAWNLQNQSNNQSSAGFGQLAGTGLMAGAML